MQERDDLKLTERIYYQDSHCFSFDAMVIDCLETKQGPALILDRTAFFPEGGGQPADTGVLKVNGSSVTVSDVRDSDGMILHMVSEPLPIGTGVHGELNVLRRLQNMQSHSGEHIFSGIAHRLYDVENVGFHVGEDSVIIDFDKELHLEDIEIIEEKANEAVRANLPVKAWFPKPDELAAIDYRSKLELTHDVRLVEIPGVDICACCAPHVYMTGEVGCVRVVEFMRHRGGVRIFLVFGMQALELYHSYKENLAQVSALLSVPRTETAEAVKKLLTERDRLKQRSAELNLALAEKKAEQYPETEGNICLFDDMLDEPAVRELVNGLMPKCEGVVAVLFGGSDDIGYRYIIGSRTVNLRQASREINAEINGRGGGKPEMIQGSAAASREKIELFFRGKDFLKN